MHHHTFEIKFSNDWSKTVKAQQDKLTWSSTPLRTNRCSREGTRLSLCTPLFTCPGISCGSTIISHCSIVRSNRSLLLLQLLCFLWIPIEEKINLEKESKIKRVRPQRKRSYAISQPASNQFGQGHQRLPWLPTCVQGELCHASAEPSL